VRKRTGNDKFDARKDLLDTFDHVRKQAADLASGQLGSDDDLSQTVNKLGIPVYLDSGKPMKYAPNPDNPKDVSYREYWAQGLKNHCPDLFEPSVY
jgi:hypothetical protein